MQEQLSSPLSQVLKTYDFGNLKNCDLNTDINLVYPFLHPPMYQMCRNPHRRASFLMEEYVPLVHIAPASFVNERDLPLQMEAH